MVLRHQVHRVGSQDLRAAQLAALQYHLRERQIVARGAVETAAAHEELGVLGQRELDRREPALVVPLVHAREPGPL